MLITKFNKMIRNRIVWWIIGGIVIITFVGWFSPHGGCEYKPGAGEAGTFNKEPVTDLELRTARFNTYLDVCMASGRKPAITPELDAILVEMAWKRVAALHTAKAMGLENPSNAELLAELQRQSLFQENGAFSRNRYLAFEKNVLAPLGVAVSQFENKLREDIILMKLQSTTAAAAWISPAEFQRVVSRYADNLSVEYVTLQTNLVKASDIKLTPDDLKAYFEAHTNFFEVPAKVAVRYVVLPVSNHLATAVADNAGVEEYYDTHTDEFTATDTNGAKVITPLDEVRVTISNRLLLAFATQAARDIGTDLAVALAPQRDGTASDFEKVAADFGLAVRTTALFAADAPVPGIDSDIDFITAAFKLRPTPEDYFSDPVTGLHYVYVLALATNTDAYVPSFDEAQAKVEPFAMEKAVQDALLKNAESIRLKLQEGLGKGEKFAAVARQQAMNVHTSGYFSAYAAPEALSSPDILEQITLLGQGDVSSVLTATNGHMIAYMADRRPASDQEVGVVREQLGRGMIRRRARVIFSEWQDNLLRTGRALPQQATDRTSADQ
jgi:hypothetical protein